ncbi:bifunctional homocysteine S-methyltransferase/5,10-methylenetetrahydrofolate reductase [Paenibacillus baekrokdamisoli]|uniref:Bifunctional homocysteine S-methyltransferase/5,10-methylenetetrahydrofolate reductase n=1 Tax=Paenibacillus baekrokdamisoli TaxID=1712516 RepID=A0A3G9J760_9BACL|nr:bifunctional homocysteine S-methyltransferase/methylenetetrahydrofolate reductase [Paenibacillus baekrokdamisoli]MBB3067170.1 homocysteine S-methyltransferase [Paenibacillus baekrokdamisoli]BBH19638.1 bifunctional homocysteine S-methyltransferase/5,10-methylenetetrahydrofolate reductase [Paenibacillus baekrokdamisoli]
MKPDLREALKTRILTGDGAMGTYLYQMGFPVGVSYEEFNLLRPNVIEDLHRRYYEAGARIIETNTFSANYESLSRYGLDTDVEAINRAGVEIARSAVGSDAYVVGAIGSIRAGKRKNIRSNQLTQSFHQQIDALLSAGADGLLLETFYDLEEVLLALRLIRKVSNIPVICQFAVEKEAVTQDGHTLAVAFETLRLEGADVVGFNCRSGPNGIMRAIDSIHAEVKLPLSVFPNAGIPDYVDGKYMYTASPEYFAESARKFADRGARIIGGCCGTTPEHIAAIAAALDGYQPQPVAIDLQPPDEKQRPVITITAPSTQEVTPADTKQEPSIVDLVKQRHTVIVELDPPRDLDIRKFMDGAKALKAIKADAVTLADNSLAVTRMSNLALASLIQQQVGIKPLVHIACRDRNLVGTQSHLMGLDALDIDHVLAVTGDPARFGDLPDSSSVYDLTSFEMIRMIKQLNEGVSFSGKPLKQKAKFITGAAFNPNVKYLDKAVTRLERKIASGADYIMTQPVYDKELIIRMAEAVKHLSIPVFIGIMPLASGRNAEYLHNEVPGIQLSDEVRQRMAGLEGEAGRAEGVRIAEELLDTAMQHFNGIYLITPFMFYEMTVQLTDYVWRKTGI